MGRGLSVFSYSGLIRFHGILGQNDLLGNLIKLSPKNPSSRENEKTLQHQVGQFSRAGDELGVPAHRNGYIGDILGVPARARKCCHARTTTRATRIQAAMMLA